MKKTKILSSSENQAVREPGKLGWSLPFRVRTESA